jgi:DNA replication protein DnaC
MVLAAAEWNNACHDGQAPRWISFLGNSGIGKTYLATALWHKCKNKFDWNGTAYQRGWVYWPDFISELKKGESYNRRDDMKRWPLLFLDDVGAPRDPSGFAAEELHTLLGCRMGRWTIVTANLTLEEVAKIDMRISSRMIRDQNIMVQSQALDYALRKNK